MLLLLSSLSSLLWFCIITEENLISETILFALAFIRGFWNSDFSRGNWLYRRVNSSSFIVKWSFPHDAAIYYPDSKVHGAHLIPVSPRWAPCWPYEPCYQGAYCTQSHVCDLIPIVVAVLTGSYSPCTLLVPILHATRLWNWSILSGLLHYDSAPLTSHTNRFLPTHVQLHWIIHRKLILYLSRKITKVKPASAFV